MRSELSETVDVVLTNPPFGKKSSSTVINEEGDTDKESITYNRPDFWTTTSNKQVNVVQHVKSLLKIHGRAAVVVPDNVLFQGGAGEKVRRKLLQECEVHTLLRLPGLTVYSVLSTISVLHCATVVGRLRGSASLKTRLSAITGR